MTIRIYIKERKKERIEIRSGGEREERRGEKRKKRKKEGRMINKKGKMGT